MEAPTSPDISTSSLVDEFGGLDLHLSDDFFNLDNSKTEEHYNLSSLSTPELSLNVKQEFPSIEQIKIEHNKESSTRGNERTSKETKVTKGKKGPQQPKKSRGIQKEPKKPVDPKYHKRLQANKKSAQASRERRKSLKAELETIVGTLQKENKSLQTNITELETENQVLKKEFVTLQNIIMENPLLSKLFSKAGNFILPPAETTNSAITSIAAMQMIILLYSFRQQLTMNSIQPHVQQSIPTVVV